MIIKPPLLSDAEYAGSRGINSYLNPASPKKQAAVPAFFILNFFLKSADAVLPMYLWHLILYTSEITKNYENFLATGQV